MKCWLAMWMVLFVASVGIAQERLPLLDDGEIRVPTLEGLESLGATPAQQQDLYDYLQGVLDDSAYSRFGGIGSILAVEIPGEPIWVGAVGYASRGTRSLRDENGQIVRDEWRGIAREGDVRIQPDDPFYIASCSKVFLSTLVLMLVEDGELTLEDTLHQWLPEVNLPNADRITIRHLLNHTGGVFNYTDNLDLWNDMVEDPELSFTPWELIEYMLGQPATFEPGARRQWSYSNSGYVLTGLIIERALSQSLAEAMRERIFEPNGMSEIWSANQESHPEVALVGHTPQFTPQFFFDMSWGYAAGQLLSSAENLTRFLGALLRERSMLTADSMDEMLDELPVYDYGLGIGVVDVPSGPARGTLYSHSGRIPGYTSIYYHHKESGVTVVQFHNGDSIKEGIDHPFAVAELALVRSVEEAGEFTSVVEWSLY